MASRQPPIRHYTALQLKSLFDGMNAGANSWDDVLLHLRSLRGADAFPREGMPELVDDLRRLRNDNVHFTADYRELWNRLTGENIDGYEGTRNDVAPSGAASSRVLDVLRRVRSKEYRALSERSDSFDGPDWDNRPTRPS